MWKLLLYKPLGFPCLFFSKAHRLASFSSSCPLSSYANRSSSNFKIFRIKAPCSASSSSLSDSSLAHLSASFHLLRCTPNNSIRDQIDLNREYMSFCSSSYDFPPSDMSQPLFLLNRSASSSANFLSAYLALSLPSYSALDDRLASSSLTLPLRLWLLQSPFSKMALLSPLTVFPLCLLLSRASLFTARVVIVTIRSTIPMVQCHFWSPFLITKSLL